MRSTHGNVSSANLERLESGKDFDESSGSFAACYRRARKARSDNLLRLSRVTHDPLSSAFAAIAIQRQIHPSFVSLTSLITAFGASATVISLANSHSTSWLPGLVAFVGWQLSYVLDCADGQVARATATVSDFGARLDLLIDIARDGSIVCALIAVITSRSEPPTVLLAACVSLWTLTLFVVAINRTGDVTVRPFDNTTRVAQIVRTTRDSGFLLPFIGGWLIVSPSTVLILVLGVSFVNASYLVALISRFTWLSIHTPNT
jgi:phosphatidylglycerophosphate synthase